MIKQSFPILSYILKDIYLNNKPVEVLFKFFNKNYMKPDT